MKGKSFFLALLFVAVLGATTGHAYASGTDAKEEEASEYWVVTISPIIQSDGHIGDDWIYEFRYNGKLIESGDVIKASKTRMHFKTTIIEDDDIPDVGESDFHVQPPLPSSISSIVIVEETGGHSGTKTIFSVKYYFEPYIEEQEEINAEEKEEEKATGVSLWVYVSAVILILILGMAALGMIQPILWLILYLFHRKK